jgi:hypothetical protein
VPCARLIKQAAGLLRTRFIPHDTRWQAARRGLQLVGLDRFLYIYLLYGWRLSLSLSLSLSLFLSLSFSLSLSLSLRPNSVKQQQPVRFAQARTQEGEKQQQQVVGVSQAPKKRNDGEKGAAAQLTKGFKSEGGRHLAADI